MSTGPFIQTWGSNGGAGYYYSNSMRSGRDVNGRLVLETLPYRKVHRWCGARRVGMVPPSQGWSCGWLVASDIEGFNSVGAVEAYASAYDKFRTRAWNDAQASIGVDFAERKSTIRMLGDGVVRLAAAAVAVRKGRLAEAADILGVGYREPRRKKGKTEKRKQRVKRRDNPSQIFAENWLALQYGWLPTLSSVYSAAAALANPVKDRFVTARGSKLTVRTRVTSSDKFDEVFISRVTLKARVRVENQTIATLNQWGVLNPLLVAWELVPFSFVADWFLPIGALLEDLSGMAGLVLEDASATVSNTRAVRVERTATIFNNPIKRGDWATGYGVAKLREKRSVFTTPRRTFEFGLNPKRALDAVSLFQSIVRGYK